MMNQNWLKIIRKESDDYLELFRMKDSYERQLRSVITAVIIVIMIENQDQHMSMSLSEDRIHQTKTIEHHKQAKT